MVLRLLIEGGIDDFHIRSLNRFFNVGDLLRPLVDQKDDQIHLRVVPQDGFCRILQKRRFSGFRRGDDHASLAFSDRTYKIHDPHRHASARALKAQPLIREDRCHIFEIAAAHDLVERQIVDAL